MTDSPPAVRLTGLAKRFGTVRAVAGLDLTVRAGETVALLGPNGAGKSTTISILLDLVRPDAGSVALFGTPAGRAVRAGRVGTMLQGGELPWYATVADLLALARAVYSRPLPAEEVLASAGLARLARRRVQRLSGGEMQRARFAFALAGDPRPAGARRTDRRDGRRHPAGLLGRGPPPGRDRPHGAVRHALPGGGGRVRRPDRGVRCGPGGRGRLRRGDQADGGRPPGQLPAGGRAGSTGWTGCPVSGPSRYAPTGRCSPARTPTRPWPP